MTESRPGREAGREADNAVSRDAGRGWYLKEFVVSLLKRQADQLAWTPIAHLATSSELGRCRNAALRYGSLIRGNHLLELINCLGACGLPLMVLVYFMDRCFRGWSIALRLAYAHIGLIGRHDATRCDDFYGDGCRTDACCKARDE